MSYQYRKYHSGDKTILWLSYLHNGISHSGKTSLYCIMTLVLILLVILVLTNIVLTMIYLHFDGLKQERHNSTANALESSLSCTNPSISRPLWTHDSNQTFSTGITGHNLHKSTRIHLNQCPSCPNHVSIHITCITCNGKLIKKNVLFKRLGIMIWKQMKKIWFYLPNQLLNFLEYENKLFKSKQW